MRLKEIKELKGKITLVTGLHIGAGDMEMKIGGTDNAVIKHPHTMEPYIPGSSLKGKVRALLEMQSGFMLETEGAPISGATLRNLIDKNNGAEKKDQTKKIEQAEKIVQLFGASDLTEDQAKELGPTRVSFADAYLDDEYKDKVIMNQNSFVEVKAENRINRIKGTAQDPRFTERVPAEAVFSFTISLKVMENDQGLEELLLKGLRLLEMDALGGNGSRGYGKVKFTFEDKEVQQKFEEASLFDQ